MEKISLLKNHLVVIEYKKRPYMYRCEIPITIVNIVKGKKLLAAEK